MAADPKAEALTPDEIERVREFATVMNRRDARAIILRLLNAYEALAAATVKDSLIVAHAADASRTPEDR